MKPCYVGLSVFVNGKLVGIHNRVSTVLNARENGSYTEFLSGEKVMA